jgi:hypothetical protein
LTRHQEADRAEPRDERSPAAKRKSAIRGFAHAMQVLEHNIPSLHTPITWYVRALSEEAKAYREQARDLRAELDALRGEVRGHGE